MTAVKTPAAKVSIELPAADMKWLCAAVLPAVSADDATPVICNALFVADDGKLTAISTDRYRVHRASIDCDVTFPPFMVPRRMLSWIVANATFFGRSISVLPAVIRLDVTLLDGFDSTATLIPGGAITATALQHHGSQDQVALTVEMTKGNYPPVERLIVDALAAEPVADSGGFIDLGLLRGSAALAESRYERAKLTSIHTSDKKPGQTLIQYKRGTALIQGSDFA